MPDLQSELNKVLSQAHFDDAPDEQAPQTATRSWNGRVFDYIKANPMASYSEVADATGTDPGTAASRLKDMWDRGVLTRGKYNGLLRYSVAVDEYVEFDRMAAIRKAIEAKKAKAVQRAAEAIEKAKVRKPRGKSKAPKAFAGKKVARPVTKETAAKPATLDDVFSPEAFVASLPLPHARAIYNLLKEYFA